MTFFKLFKQPFYNDDDGLPSGNNQDVADPDVSDIDNNNLDTDKGEKDPEPAEPDKQSNEDNAKYAAARREAERIAAQEKQRAAKLERDNMIARKYGKDYEVFSEEDIKTKYGSQGINTLEELENAIHEQKYRDAGIDPNLIKETINNHPVVKQAQTYVDQLKEKQRQDQIKNDIDNLHKEFPGAFDYIKQEQDIYKDLKWSEVGQWLDRGYELSDAYYKVYKSDIINKTTQNTVKSTIANIQDRSKRGVVSSGDAGDETIVDLSSEGKEMANAFGVNPKNVAKYVKEKLKK